jgi:hypothetical protein
MRKDPKSETRNPDRIGNQGKMGNDRRRICFFPLAGFRLVSDFVLRASCFPLLIVTAAALAAEPENLAPKARVTASSTYSEIYEARYAVDGKVPDAESREDARQAWCVKGTEANGKGEFMLEWPQPVTVAEVVYWGRTGWSLLDTFKGYEVYLDNDAQPAARGAFELRHGPQRIAVAPRQVTKVRIKFLSAHGPYNPGASEIAVYSASPSQAALDSLGDVASPLRDEVLSGKLGFRDLLVIKRHHISTSHVYTYHAEGFVPGGGLYVYTPATGQLRELVNASAGEIMDCDLSFDSKEVVFSWKQKGPPGRPINFMTTKHCTEIPGEDYQVFRINVDGTGLKQLTDGPCNNLNACWLPDGGIAFISDRTPAFAYCFVSTSPILHRMDRDGSNVQRLSSSYLMDFTPSALNDGRIIYTRWEYVDRPAIPIQSLWAIRPDGTALAGFFGNRVLDPGTFMQAKSIPNTGKVLCLLTSHNGDPRGAIGIVDPSRSGNGQEAIRNLTPEVNIGRVDRGNGNILVNAGPYETPCPVDDRYYVLSKAGAIQVRDYEGKFPPATLLRKPGGGLGFYSPIPIKPRQTPPVLPPQQRDENAGPWATLVLADVYNGLEPHVKRGEVKEICVVEEIAKSQFAPLIHDGVPGAHGYAANTAFGYQFPLVSCGATYAPKRIWGYADVAADGSAYFKVPTGIPVYFLALDAQGRAVQRMRTFTHFMPGERQSCSGCHADRNYITATSPGSPQDTAQSSNLVGRALAARQGNNTGLRLAEALQSAPQELRQPDWGVKGFSYREVVQPVLDKNCVRCHNARQAPRGVDLSGEMTDFFNVSYDILARKGTWGELHPEIHGINASQEGHSPYTSWIATVNGTEHNILQITPRTWGSPASKLADIVLTGHPGTDGKPRISLDPASQRRIMAWIDLNVPYYPTSSSKNFHAMGCRRVFPTGLDAALKQVAATRCNRCHAQGVPRAFYTRIEKPELNNFLLAPLAKAAGGTEACGTAVFAGTDDPDYQAILKTFEPVAAFLREQPRDDMPGALWCAQAPAK